MKRFTDLCCAWALAACLIAIGAVDATAANMLLNPGFATVPNPATDWTLTTGADRIGASSHDADGAVLRFREDTTPVNGWATASQKLTAAPGQVWTYTAYVLCPSGAYLQNDDYGLLDMTFRTSSGGTSSTQSANLAPTDNSVWYKTTITATAPANTTEVTFSAKFYHGDTAVVGKLYFDDFFAEGIPPVPEPHVVWAAVPVLLLAIGFRKRLMHV